ncbi:MAG TPA: peptidoglycan-associated lipoprotein Pal [Devosiaceae bacterium]|jgi:peptidoglycan-associated lipoprotein|nr:peptidoglycan-associated lipoprotein Pal [Devosiaceae bacterium]
MRSLAPTLGILRGFALVALVVVLAACSRNPSTGVGNLGPNGGPPGSQQEFLVSVGDRVFFDTDQSGLSPTAIATLDKQAAWLNRYTNYQHILIEGHSDERGTREYNIALGARRANTVMNYLISKGVASSRLTMKSFGKERPVALCDDISCWSQNRRAVTVVQ